MSLANFSRYFGCCTAGHHPKHPYLEDEVCEWGLRVEHGEGELVVDLLAVELLRVLEEVDERVHLLAAVPRARHKCVRLHLAQVAPLVVARRSPG